MGLHLNLWLSETGGASIKAWGDYYKHKHEGEVDFFICRYLKSLFRFIWNIAQSYHVAPAQSNSNGVCVGGCYYNMTGQLLELYPPEGGGGGREGLLEIGRLLHNLW